MPALARRLVDQSIENDGNFPIIVRQSVYRREKRQFQLIAGAAAIVAAAAMQLVPSALLPTAVGQLRVVSYNVAQLNGDQGALSDVLAALADDDTA